MIPQVPTQGSDKRTIDVPLSFPQQHQDCMPGLECNMTPRPISENTSFPAGARLSGKAALITGGDSGIGRAVAYAFAREGADVAIVYLSEDGDAEETQRHVQSMGRQCLSIRADLRQEQAAMDAVQQAVTGLGKLDILVNNCAVQTLQNSIADITEAQLDDTFRTNLYSYFFMTKAALPHLQGGSSILNTTSITAYAGSADLLDYSASKGAILSFTRSLALSLAPQGIRVNGVAPGPVWTPLIPASFAAADVETFGTAPSPPPMGRAGQPFEIAGCYVFLASDEASYISGQVLHPNGGKIVNG